jgi:membrane protease YdiL (CAAX protease family)
MLFDPERRLRLPWRLLIYLVGLAGIQLAAGIAVAVVLIGYLALRGEPFDLTIFDRWILPLTIVAAPVLTAAAIVLTVLCRRYLDRRNLQSLGLVYPIPRPAATLAGGAAAGGAPILLAAAVLLAIGAFDFRGLGGDWLTFPLLPTLVLMAFFEEITFRGYLLQNFVEVGRPKLGVLLTSLLFWLAHSLNPDAWTTPVNALNLFGAGVALALAYLVSCNLWLPTAIHFGWNAAQGVLLDVPVSGIDTPGWILVEPREGCPVWMTGGSFGLEGSVVTLALLVVLIAVLAAFYRRQLATPKSEKPIGAAELIRDFHNPYASQ